MFVKGTEISTRKRISRRSLIFTALTTHNDVWSGRKERGKKTPPNQQEEIRPGVVFRVEEQPGPAAKRRTTCCSSVRPGWAEKYDFIATHSARLPERWRKVRENSIRRHIRKPGSSHGVIWKNVHAELILPLPLAHGGALFQPGCSAGSGSATSKQAVCGSGCFSEFTPGFHSAHP